MKWEYFAIAATAVAALAGVYLYLKKKTPPAGLVFVKIINQEKYKELTELMRDYFKEKYQKMIKEYRENRRKLDSDSKEYEGLVALFNDQTHDLLFEAQIQILKSYGLNQKHFEISVNYYASDPEYQNYVKQIVNTKAVVSEKDILGKERIKEILDHYQNRLKEYESQCPDIDEYMIINARIEDEIFSLYNVELDVINASWEVYKKEFEDRYEPIRNQTYCVLASSDNSF